MNRIGVIVVSFNDPVRLARCLRSVLNKLRDPAEPVAVPWIKGACLAVRAEVFREVGLFDEGFRMYAEDMDFCRRIRNRGWEIYSVPAALAVHSGGHVPALRSAELVNVYYESLARYYTKHIREAMGGLMLLLNRIERWQEMRSCTRRLRAQE